MKRFLSIVLLTLVLGGCDAVVSSEMNNDALAASKTKDGVVCCSPLVGLHVEGAKVFTQAGDEVAGVLSLTPGKSPGEWVLVFVETTVNN